MSFVHERAVFYTQAVIILTQTGKMVKNPYIVIPKQKANICQ